MINYEFNYLYLLIKKTGNVSIAVFSDYTGMHHTSVLPSQDSETTVLQFVFSLSFY